MQLLAMVIDLQGFDYTLEYTRRSSEFFKTLQIKFYQQLPWILQELLLLKLYSPASLSVHGVAGNVWLPVVWETGTAPDLPYVQ